MISLTALEWNDLALSLDNIPPKNHATTADARKCIGAVEQIRKGIKEEAETLDSIKREAAGIMSPYQEKLKNLGDEKDDTPEKSKKRKKIQDEANKDLEEVNTRYIEFSKKEISIDLDKNYHDYIKSVWETAIRPVFINTKAMVKIADALGI